MVLIKNKVLQPVIDHRLIRRQTLIDNLEVTEGKKLILLSASAGSGKTSLVSSWLAEKRADKSPPHIAWYTISEEDDAPKTFCHYLLYALSESGYPGFESNGKTNLEDADIREVVSIILNTLIDAIEGRSLFLVLDDFHLINSPEIHKALDLLLKHLPSGACVALLSRNEPPLNLSNLRVNNQIIEIRNDDIRFSLEESQAFLVSRLPDDPEMEFVENLHHKTEGWVTGLQLAAISIQDQKDISDMLISQENQIIIDYLLEEIYTKLPDDRREFLVKISFLDSFTPKLCEAVTSNKQSERLTRELVRDNLFVTEVDPENGWYRFHQLFGDMLRKRLRYELQDEVYSLRQKAAEWFEKNSYLLQAFNCALSSLDSKTIARIAERYAVELWVGGEHTSLLFQLNRIPLSIMDDSPALSIYKVWLLINSGQTDKATHIIRNVESNNSLSVTHIGALETAKAYLSNFKQDVDGIEKHARAALDAFGNRKTPWRSAAATVLGYAFSLSGNLLQAEKSFREALALTEQDQNDFFYLLAGFNLAYILRYQGRLDEAKSICELQLRQLEEYNYPQYARKGGLFSILADIACERNDLETALRYASRGVELSEKGNNIPLRSYAYAMMINISINRGEIDDARNMLEKTLELKTRVMIPVWIENTLSLWRFYLLFLENKPAEAMRILDIDEILRTETIPFSMEMRAMAAIRVLLMSNQSDSALQVLDSLSSDIQNQRRWMIHTHSLISRAVYYLQTDQMGKAEETLDEALYQASEANLLRTFIHAGDLINPILKSLKAKNRLNDFGQAVLNATDADNSQTDLDKESAEFLDPLTPREMEVIKLIPSNLGYPEIADEMGISYSTVRSHMKSIYSKLDAHSRLEAINIARRVGLI